MDDARRGALRRSREEARSSEAPRGAARRPSPTQREAAARSDGQRRARSRAQAERSDIEHGEYAPLTGASTAARSRGRWATRATERVRARVRMRMRMRRRDPMRDELLHPRVIDRVEERADVRVEHPAHLLARDRDGQRIEGFVRRPARPETVRKAQEFAYLVDRIHQHPGRLLHDLVLDRGDPEWSMGAIGLRNVHARDGLRVVATAMTRPSRSSKRSSRLFARLLLHAGLPGALRGPTEQIHALCMHLRLPIRSSLSGYRSE